MQVIDDIIEPEQNAYIPGWSIFNNVRTIIKAIKYSEDNNTENILVSLDFYKCFDTINRDFIWECMQASSFGEKYINMAKTAYEDNIEACVFNNGTLGPFFKL